VAHEGKLIEDVGWFWDHADERSVIAHDYLLANSVCPSGAHYPMEWKRCKKREACAAGECKDHTQLCLALSEDAVARGIPGDFTFDGYFTSAKVLNHLQSQQRAYVGDLQLNRHVVYDGREQSLQAVARQIPWAQRNPCAWGRGGIGALASRGAFLTSIIPCAYGCFGRPEGTKRPARRW
jgi:hypothetical protein